MAQPSISWAQCKLILRQGIARYFRVRKRLSDPQKARVEEVLRGLQSAYDRKDREQASQYAVQLESQMEELLPEPAWQRWMRSVGTLLLTLIVLVLVRQMWFELYVIPTGSMRPTFKEQDRLIVSKTAFGINPPLGNGHLYWDSSLVQPGSVIVFTTEGLPVPDHWDRFLWVLPVRRQLVKRCMGTEGMTLYFYGGQVWALDAQGQPTAFLREPPWVHDHDYVPYIRPEGHFIGQRPGSTEVGVQQWNQVLSRWVRQNNGSWQPEIRLQDRWMVDQPVDAQTAYPAGGPKSYVDFWGFRHHALCRMRTDAATLKQLSSPCRAVLEVWHTPQMRRMGPISWATAADLRMDYQRALVPIGDAQWERLRGALYTVRIVVQKGYAYAYSYEIDHYQPTSQTPQLPGVPDGIYEIFSGVVYEVGWGGMSTALPRTHPLYQEELLPALFNFGIDCSTLVTPGSPLGEILPSRFTYFRQGDLYVMGHPIWQKEDAELQAFLATQDGKGPNFLPFKDFGPPTAQQIRQFGYRVPQHSVIGLGDNHARSGDSREFGPVSMENLVGSPSVLLFPYGDDARIGSIPQPPRPWCTFPNLLIGGLGIATVVGTEWWGSYRRRRRV